MAYGVEPSPLKAQCGPTWWRGRTLSYHPSLRACVCAFGLFWLDESSRFLLQAITSARKQTNRANRPASEIRDQVYLKPFLGKWNGQLNVSHRKYSCHEFICQVADESYM